MTALDRRSFGKLLASTAAFALIGGPAFAQSATPPAPVKGGTLRLVTGVEPPIQIELLQNAGGASVGARVVEGLVTEDQNNVLQPQLAERWEVSPDGKTFTFHLKEGVTWHDGTPFTSEDVAYTYLQLKEIHPRRRNTFANLEAIDTPDAQTVVLRFSKPAPFLLPALNANSAPIVPKHLYAGSDPRTNKYNSAPVGTGPYRFVEWVPGSHTVLERNPDFRDPELPLFDTVLIRYITDPVARLAAFEADEVDIGFSTPVPLGELERLKASGQFDIETRGYDMNGAQNQIFFNLRSPPFQDVRVRQAVAHAIDIPAYIQKVWQGYAVASPTIIPPTNKQFHDPSLVPYSYDPALSEKLLDAAGFPRGADGKRFKVRLTANPFMSQIQDGAQFVRSALGEVGIDVQLQSYDFVTYVKKVYTEGAFDLDIQVLSAGYDPTDGILRGYHSRNIKQGLSWSNHSTYSSPEADALFDAGSAEIDPEKRRQIYVELQRLIYADLPSVNLVAYQPVTVARKSLHDYFVDQQGASSHFARAWSSNS
ncbi:ABC transporter substrate-binding protein [Segnochrobactraceae bacterium EtOH-i3]